MRQTSDYQNYIQACRAKAIECDRLRQEAMARGDLGMAEHWERIARQHLHAAEEMHDLTRLDA